MYLKTFIFLFLSAWVNQVIGQEKTNTIPKFELGKDLLLVHYDCKTDVDDLHSAAAFATLLATSKYSKLNYHVVGGTYGMQKGLYVPPEALLDLAFGSQWSDAHNNYEEVLNSVTQLATKTLNGNGAIWIAEGGQSDFTFDLMKALKKSTAAIDTKRIHVVQHSDWNEKVTTPKKLDYVKEVASYHKIPDGNTAHNGTPGFRSEEIVPWENNITDPQLTKVWKLALQLGNQYNGKEGRYLNKAIEKGGLDFSDFAEVCWILRLENLEDASAYFQFVAD